MNLSEDTPKTQEELTFEEFKQEVLNDYKLANISRECSLLGRREVLTGKAKFGIFGDGKEVAQIAMAKFFEKGDWRSGYYRDQTFMMAIGELTVEQFFAALYAHTDLEKEPMSGGRQMGGHYATHTINPDGTWRNLTELKNSSSDISPTSGQMPRLLGLALASKVYKENELLHDRTQFSKKGREVAFGTIGDASTSEGHFWETMNAASVMQVPMVVSVWDDGHGISVPKKYQTTKESISEALSGFEKNDNHPSGIKIYKTKGWNYPHLIETYKEAVEYARQTHTPVLIHVEEVTQPQGHSTSGSHERYKSPERLQWEKDFDPIKKMGEWMIENGIATQEELEAIQKEAKKRVREGKNKAWADYLAPIKKEHQTVLELCQTIAEKSQNKPFIQKLIEAYKEPFDLGYHHAIELAKKTLRYVRTEEIPEKEALKNWLKQSLEDKKQKYSAHLYNETPTSCLNITPVSPEYSPDAEMVDGRIILRDNFDKILEKYPEVSIFGEDSGKIGGVNQGLEGLQAKYGEIRVFDTGIREATIVGQGVGMAMRGLRPIAEIQYLDYLLFGLEVMSDDLATVQYRTNGTQQAPLIIRTRGHRLEGIWHSGSPMGMIINAVRGMYVCVPRNMTQAAGMYNTLLEGSDPALIIESLNGYRLKEPYPSNIGEFKVPLGVPEIMREGEDITIITYGSLVRMAVEAAKQLQEVGISAEIIDVQTLLPFDIHHSIVESLNKTNKVLFLDEDVPGGASAYMMQKVLEEQKGYLYLDSEPQTLTAKEHRPAYGTDGDYFSKPSVEDIFDKAYQIMHEYNPEKYPSIY